MKRIEGYKRESEQIEIYACSLKRRLNIAKMPFVTQINLYLPCIPNENPNRLSLGTWETDSKIHVEEKMLKNSKMFLNERESCALADAKCCKPALKQ